MALNKSECRQVATEEVDRLEREHPPEVLGMIRQILAERTAKPKGRRVEADWEALLEMARLLRDEVAVSVREAAGRVCDQVEGLSREAIIDRLRGKYRKHQTRLQEELAEETATKTGTLCPRVPTQAQEVKLARMGCLGEFQISLVTAGCHRFSCAMFLGSCISALPSSASARWSSSAPWHRS